MLLISSVLFSSDNEMRLSFNNYSSTKKENNWSNSLSKPMIMSLLIPGLGQYVQGNKNRALGFFSLELTLIYLQNFYNNKADNKVDEYQSYASQHWSFEDWIINYEYWNDEENEFYNLFSNESNDEGYVMIWGSSHHINFYINNHPECPSGLYSTSDIEILGYENNGYGIYYDFINHNPEKHNGMGFVEFYGIEIIEDHHFHEGIRKYNMFFAGWDDAVDGIEQETQPSGYMIATSNHKKEYNDIWDKSIDFYDYTQYALTSLYLNHLISMFDIYLKDKFDNRFDLKATYDYNKYSESTNYSLMLSFNLK